MNLIPGTLYIVKKRIPLTNPRIDNLCTELFEENKIVMFLELTELPNNISTWWVHKFLFQDQIFTITFQKGSLYWNTLDSYYEQIIC